MKETTTFYKQIDEKHVQQEVSQMLWNPKMDLIALALTNGDVHLYRLSWQKVWSLNTPSYNSSSSSSSSGSGTNVMSISVKTMCWRPDGKILAIAYTNNHLRLVGVEDAKKIFSFNCKDNIESLYWIQQQQNSESNDYYDDISNRLLPKQINYDLIYHLFESSTSTTSSSSSSRQQSQQSMNQQDNLLINDIKSLTYLICSHTKTISIFIYGYFLLIDRQIPISMGILNSAYLNDTCSQLTTLSINKDNNELLLNNINTQLINDNSLEIMLISYKYGILFTQLNNLKNIIREMEEQWEDVLLEMDKKFQSYALGKYQSQTTQTTQIKQEPFEQQDHIKPNIEEFSSSLLHDFLQLFSLGYCTNHFKTFLIHELTEKGLKKLEQSVESYYTNIQRLLNGQFNQLLLTMFYHLNELIGMIKWFNKFKIFTLNETQLQQVINNCVCLLLKGQELNYTIEQNLKEIKLFFKWLQTCLVQLTNDDQLGGGTATTTTATNNASNLSSLNDKWLNEDMENLIIDFINQSFINDKTINLEKVGKYLKESSLSHNNQQDDNQDDCSQVLNDWQLFIKDKSYLNDYLYLNKYNKSLINCFNLFKQSLNDCFRMQAIKENYLQLNNNSNGEPYLIHKFDTNIDDSLMLNKTFSTSYKCFDDNVILTCILIDKTNDCYLIKQSMNSVASFKIQFNLINQLQLFNLNIYNNNYLTCMAIDSNTKSNTYLLQIDIDKVVNKQEGEGNDCRVPIDCHFDIKSLVLNDNKSCLLSISNTRRVASLLSSSRQRVLLFETEVDNDDDEDDGNENDDNKENTQLNESQNKMDSN